MTVFVINLARRPDRLAHMRGQLSDFERIEAVDGATVRNPPVSRFRFWCAKGYRIRPGEIGAALSHQKAYRLMIERNLDVACILEDDCTLAPHFRARAEELAESVRTVEPTVLTFSQGAVGTLVNRAAAELLLRLNRPIRSTLDDWARWQRGGLVRRQVEGLLTHLPYGDPQAAGIGRSDIIGDASHFVANMSLGRKIVHKCCRIFGKLVDVLS